MAKGGPKVILTFAGDAKALEGTLKRVDRATKQLDTGITRMGAGFGALQGGAIAAGVGAGGAILGVAGAFGMLGWAALNTNDEIKASFTKTGEEISAKFAKLATPLVEPIKQAGAQISTLLDDIGPQITGIFTAMGPMITTLTGGFGELVKGAMPGFQAAMVAAQPIVDALAYGMQLLGPAIGEMFTNMIGGQDGAQRIADTIKQLFDWIAWGLPYIGSLIHWLIEFGPTLASVAGFIYGVVTAVKIWNLVQTAFNIIMMANPIVLIIVAIVALIAIIIYAWNNCETFRNVVKAVWEGIKAAFQAGVDKAKALFAWFGTLPGLIGGWFGQVKDWIVRKWNDAIAWIKGIPGKILGALGNLGQLLVNSGRSIIDGFLGGLKRGWETVKGWVTGAMDWLRGFWPFSPAERGAFSGTGYVDRSGKALTTDFAASLKKGMPMVASAASDLLGAAQGGLSANVRVGSIPAGVGSTAAAAPTLQIAGGTDSALAAMLTKLARTGQLKFQLA